MFSSTVRWVFFFRHGITLIQLGHGETIVDAILPLNVPAICRLKPRQDNGRSVDNISPQASRRRNFLSESCHFYFARITAVIQLGLESPDLKDVIRLRREVCYWKRKQKGLIEGII